MTDHQQAALEAVEKLLPEARNELWESTPQTKWAEEILAAAEPYLRRKWADEVREEKTRVTSIDVGCNRAFGMVVGLEIAAKLLEGADHD